NSTTTLAYFDLFLANPVWDLTIDGQTNAKTSRLRSYPATIKGTLQIGTDGGGASSFNTSGLDVNIGGDLISNSSATMGNIFVIVNDHQKTTFYGEVAEQRIINNSSDNMLRFGDLIIDNQKVNGKISTVGAMTSLIRVMGDINVLSGTFELNNTVQFYGETLDNQSIISSLNSSTYLYFLKGTEQTITGKDYASLGSLRFNNNVRLDASMIVQGRLRFNTNTYFLIDDKHLVLTSTGNIYNASDTTGYIITNGALSDAGVTKEYAANGSFTFPVGVAGKYTPATLNVINTGGTPGSITVKPVNAYHPATATPTGDELQYFWNVSSTGFNNPTVRHTYAYNADDVKGNESNYVVGRYHDFQWQSPIGSIDAPGHRILINQSSNVDYIDGEYTAGLAANFSEKPILYSRVSSGNWFDGTSWSIYESGTPAYGQAPNGNPVVIKEGHSITINNNGAYANSVDIKSGAKLILGQTYQHNLGHVNGYGTINLTSTTDGSFIFPGGDYTDFMNSDISTIEYVGNGTLPAAITTYSNVKFMGAGTTKKIPAIDIIVRGNLTIEQGYLDNYSFNRNITVGGNWTSNTTSGFIAGKGKVTFNGTNSQIISTGGENFYNLQINQVNGKLTLGSAVNVSHILYLTNGIIYTTTSNILSLTSTSTSVVSGGSNNSFVQGPLSKLIATGSYFD
ncbi:MAG: hypothetical protein GX587_11845, partial [Bacteroidales bacterium]|nr:hypothetical protein [Bacteroidales bacterium]